MVYMLCVRLLPNVIYNIFAMSMIPLVRLQYLPEILSNFELHFNPSPPLEVHYVLAFWEKVTLVDHL